MPAGYRRGLLPGGASGPHRCHCPLPGTVISWSLRALALVPAEGWRLSQPGTRVVGTLDGSWAPVPGSAHPQPGRPQRGERNRLPPKSPSRMGP